MQFRGANNFAHHDKSNEPTVFAMVGCSSIEAECRPKERPGFLSLMLLWYIISLTVSRFSYPVLTGVSHLMFDRSQVRRTSWWFWSSLDGQQSGRHLVNFARQCVRKEWRLEKRLNCCRSMGKDVCSRKLLNISFPLSDPLWKVLSGVVMTVSMDMFLNRLSISSNKRLAY